MSPGERARPLRADAARNRQALIDAAEQLFAERGLAVTLDDIAAAAGLNVATAYRHFANKRELAGAFLAQKIDSAVAIAERAAAAADPWQGLTDFLRQALALMIANRDLHDIFIPGYAEESLELIDQRIEPPLEALVQRAVAAGRLRPEITTGDIGVILQMLAIVGDIPGGEQEQRQMLQRYLELMLAALRPGDSALGGTPPSARQAREATMPGPRGGALAKRRTAPARRIA